jgi:hypothetical protein
LNTGIGSIILLLTRTSKKEMWEQMIDDLYDLIGGRQTLWAATESFYRRIFGDHITPSVF